VAYGPTISPICLPTTSFSTSYAGKEAVVVGWGSLKEGMVEMQREICSLRHNSHYYIKGGTQPNVLQQVTVRIKSNAECKKNYGLDAPGGISNHMLCAGTAGKDACSVSLNE
jgi:secreted trypsin-like serine protease